jgi:hypothetical protein
MYIVAILRILKDFRRKSHRFVCTKKLPNEHNENFYSAKPDFRGVSFYKDDIVHVLLSKVSPYSVVLFHVCQVGWHFFPTEKNPPNSWRSPHSMFFVLLWNSLPSRYFMTPTSPPMELACGSWSELVAAALVKEQRYIS